jgi:hypothetical protein
MSNDEANDKATIEAISDRIIFDESAHPKRIASRGAPIPPMNTNEGLEVYCTDPQHRGRYLATMLTSSDGTAIRGWQLHINGKLSKVIRPEFIIPAGAPLTGEARPELEPGPDR